MDMPNHTDCKCDLINAYSAKVEEGSLRFELAQRDALALLQKLAEDVAEYSAARKRLGVRLLLAKKPQPPKGLYIHGNVGRGKSMLMDLFFENAPIKEKRREHFHRFMLDIHDDLHRMRADDASDDANDGKEISPGVRGALPRLVRKIAKESTLLCLDEFHISNIADAMILGRLLTLLFEAGVAVVATSNWHPDELYSGGLQRDRFLPSIETIKEHMFVHWLGGAVDHRYEHLRNLGNFIVPAGHAASERLSAVFSDLARGNSPAPMTLPVNGRTITVPRAASGVAMFDFASLCEQPLGSADYLALTECFHTIVVDGVPVFTPDSINKTLRFITFVDALYENRSQVFMSAEASPEHLCPSGPHEQAFRRTASRLFEMQSEEYRRLAHLS